MGDKNGKRQFLIFVTRGLSRRAKINWTTLTARTSERPTISGVGEHLMHFCFFFLCLLYQKLNATGNNRLDQKSDYRHHSHQRIMIPSGSNDEEKHYYVYPVDGIFEIIRKASITGAASRTMQRRDFYSIKILLFVIEQWKVEITSRLNGYYLKIHSFSLHDNFENRYPICNGEAKINFV